MSEYLFVYGTLLKNANNKMSDFLAENAVFSGKGFFHGLLFNVGPYPGATVSDSISDRVYGNFYKIDEKVLNVLDSYEEVGPNYTIPNEYKRAIITAYLNGTHKIKCWIYLYNHTTNGLQRIPSGDYPAFIEKRNHPLRDSSD